MAGEGRIHHKLSIVHALWPDWTAQLQNRSGAKMKPQITTTLAATALILSIGLGGAAAVTALSSAVAIQTQFNTKIRQVRHVCIERCKEAHFASALASNPR